MATLYELSTQANQLYNLLQSGDIDEQVFMDTLEGMGTEEKIKDYCQVIANLSADAEDFKTEIDRMTARKRAIDNNIKRMKLALLNFLQSSGQTKAKGGTFTVAISNSLAVRILDETAIPDTYLIAQPPKIDKVGIKKALKDGEDVPGADIIINEGVRIR
jgi:hypothetical protein